MIIPAILEKTEQNFIARIEQVKAVKPKAVQIDFADGVFVENKTVQISDIGELPSKIIFEAHLMIEAPSNFNDYKEKGFSKIIVHYESFKSEIALEEACGSIAELGLTPAIAINPETPVSVLRYHADTINHFALLSVTPGQQGQILDGHIYDRIAELREMAPEAIIEVDGGINKENIKKIVAAGADECAVGSAIFGNSDLNNDAEQIKKQYKELTALLK